METANRLNGIGEYYFSQKLREIELMNKAGTPVINLGIGSPDLPPHPDVIRVLHEASARPENHAYQSYKGSPVLREAIASWYREWYAVNLDADNEVLPLMGSKEGIMHICMSFLNTCDQVLIPNPGYPTYRAAVLLAGAECISYQLQEQNNWFPDFEMLEQSDLSKVKLMFVNYPHMPTGQLPTKTMLAELIAFAKKHNILLVHDNPYSFILNKEPMSLLGLPGAMECVLELNSLSKSHNMAGWRVGMLCGQKKFIDNVLRFKSNMDSGMFLPVQLAAAKALTLNKGWYGEVNETYSKRRLKIFELLELLQCRYERSQAGLFVWASVPDDYSDGFTLSDDVLKRSRVFITPGGIFGNAGDRYIRVSLCAKEETIQEAINRIKN